MSVLNKFSGLRVLFIGIFLLILINVVLNYMKIRNENSPAIQSYRRVHKYASSRLFAHNNNQNHTQSLPLESTETPATNSSILDNNVSANNETKSETKILNDTIISPVPISNVPLLTCESLTYEVKGGPIKPNITLLSQEVVEAELGELLNSGGSYQPKNCTAQDHVAIVVPFRDRYAHLSVFLRNLHPFLMKQNIAYRIFIIEQTNGKPFNRAALMNIGYLEALKLYPYDCFIFHDVDLLPLDSRNIYNCPRQPRHLSIAIDTFSYKLPYSTIFGGVSAMTRQHFKLVNGFSNLYYGWGGEDDDMSNRIKHAELYISRYPINIGRYMMLKHQKEKANPKRFENLVNGINKMESEGLNSINYEIYSFKEFSTYTWYLAELKGFEKKS